ncbi:BppU family phage baseplate upper protein [Clostridium paraputrificum]|uniref:BppU family phage baseplate upper protein n=1 Tax=Clostridium paraputrificum TaxID=29363 RepID=UPI003D32958F
MKFLRKINLEINKDLYNPIQVKQNDTARYLLFNLLDNGVPFSLENKTVRVYGLKPDGTKVFNNLTIINAARGLAELQLTTQMLVKPGCLKLELVIYEATDILSTTKFDIDVIASLRDDAAIESTNEFSALTLGLSKLDEWDKYFKETSGAIEEKYTERLNEINSSLEETKMQKVDKVEGESLTPNKYTNDDKSKVDTIPTLAPKAYVDTKVATISSGTPLFASSVTEMTDTTKNYVNIADGFLYTYNGSAFIKSTVKYQEMGLSDKQVTPVKTSFIENFDNDIAKDVPVLKGYLDYSTGAFTPSENFETTDFIELEEGIKYICEFSGSNGTNTLTTPRAIIIFNNDKSFSRRLELPAGMTSGSLSAQNSNEKYVRVNMEKTNNNLKIYPISGHKIENILSNIKVPFNNIVDIPKQEATGSSFNFIGRPRKAIISFILDGEYDMNSTMELIFSNKGFRVGFAPQYVTNWSNNPITTYLEWQAKGHEILSHGTYVLNDSASYTEEEVKTIIENSYNTLVNQGFNIKGFIGSSGKVADKYLKYVRDHYEYSATEPNHSGAYNGTGAEPCLYFKTDAPYKIWRYSIQSSTLEQMKSAVDKAIETNGLLIFYGHAQSTSNDNFTTANLTALCDYILSKKCKVLTPYEAIKEYYSIRYEDLLNSL